MQKKPPKSVREFHLGDKVEVSLHGGRIVDAVVKAIITDDKGSRLLQIDFANETALIYDWQVCDWAGDLEVEVKPPEPRDALPNNPQSGR